jgi:hypothetical protein
MRKTEKHLSEFNSNQILQIVNWSADKLKLPSNILEERNTKIKMEEVNGKEYLIGVDINGMTIVP